ncbi:uracil-DNA glycosylase [Nocardioides daphniae]|uniref:Type-5 uracil-DNA glycosylase n=1 Tax=Nocardioides daphniae TaxID=402297 RepID=A0A4P7U926_9ACTN|nr:uracil-DNA glycosylase [Nocardioides daphniae]QCC76580.1 uracil-DNA glycosylase [Nocardioides daphniae]GGD14249.1 uracil-DNA glycosylase [Nocardioides daphniae]
MTVWLPHPLTGELFDSPVPPGTGWPEDPAPTGTLVARSAAGVRRLAAAADLAEVEARVSVCAACPRLVEWRETNARGKRAAFADQPYWGRPIPGWGDPEPRVLVVGLAPAAHGGNRTGRVFTGDPSGDWLFASLHRVGLAVQATSEHAGDGQRLVGARMVARVRCAPPDNKPTPTERDTCAPWVQREVGLVLPTVRAVVALGAYGWGGALEALAGAGVEVPRPRPRFGHGAEVVMQGPHGPVTLLGCFHPSPHNTFTGRLTAEMTDAVLARARDLGTDSGIKQLDG